MLYLDLVFVVVFGLYLYWIWGLLRALKSDAPYVPMRGEIVRELVRMAHPKSGGLWIDLGSGDGRVLIEAAHTHGINGIGIERIGALRWLSRLSILSAGFRKSIRIQSGDFFKTDLAAADVVSFYLLPATAIRVMEKLKKELKPGTEVLFHRFPIPGLVLASENTELKLYRFVIPPRP